MRISEKKRMVWVPLLTVFLLISLCAGCQLAKEPTGPQTDRLCGVFVTFGDTPIPAEEVSQNMAETLSEEIILEHGTAVVTDQIVEGLINEETSPQGNAIRRANFASIPGHELIVYSYEEADPQTGETCTVNDQIVSPIFFDHHAQYHVSDTEENFFVSAQLPVSPAFSQVFRLNPVYQRPDGSIYTKINSTGGSSAMGGLGTASLTQTISENWVQTDASGTRKKTMDITVTLTGKEGVRHVSIKEFSAADQLLYTGSIADYNETVSYPLQQDTAYIILEEHQPDGGIHRELRSKTGEETADSSALSYTCYFSQGTQLLKPMEIQLLP